MPKYGEPTRSRVHNLDEAGNEEVGGAGVYMWIRWKEANL
jgi:hypothetical protein